MIGIARSVLFIVLAGSMSIMATSVHTQSSPASGPLPGASAQGSGDAAVMADFLGLLGQIAPAAEEGARTFLAAVQLRCGYTPSAEELRRAMSQGDGNPVLMGLINAAHQQDAQARTRLIGQIQCGAPQ
ncbi:MAG: hypothetical protein FWD67_04075 [Betaproteobacteria bacterium]|nr:hypothetical protein [Betaproteobacteria bacterium]